jgi:3-keto-L-gulonate-6-phosphate decarboxylase
MYTPRRSYRHCDGCERKDACATELARARNITHVADSAEQQSVQTSVRHRGEDPCAASMAQPGEVNARTVFQRHHTNRQSAVAGGGAHADNP